MQALRNIFTLSIRRRCIARISPAKKNFSSTFACLRMRREVCCSLAYQNRGIFRPSQRVFLIQPLHSEYRLTIQSHFCFRMMLGLLVALRKGLPSSPLRSLSAEADMYCLSGFPIAWVSLTVPALRDMFILSLAGRGIDTIWMSERLRNFLWWC